MLAKTIFVSTSLRLFARPAMQQQCKMERTNEIVSAIQLHQKYFHVDTVYWTMLALEQTSEEINSLVQDKF